MNIEEEVEKCEIYLKQIKQYDPDPFYVKHFFNQFILSIDNIISRIFEEANTDFGLFVSQQISEQSFNEKAKKKNDENAIKFSTWFSSKFTEEHENPYPNSIKKICDFRKKFEKLPEIKIMIRASDRYKDDINQQIKVNLNQGKIRSKEELEIEIRRQLPVFLEIINHKRREKNEPKIEENQVTASTFVEVGNKEDIEIAYASEIYIPVLKRLVEESRDKIYELSKKQ
ncbi:hypothetical protein C5F47_08350 [Nitrosopumilus cobalaminigenes]|uniref:Uncharacterized protein n=1 Tax=Nitrosopumilus cobalaminigenes TaxID=1470066 RepID=A0A7D5RCM9_9ARCH|nr:hypothetical protein [Nitrosopumilus cobalaminigenes]QLH03545.1 hypothetical protein C5F47_08350 [Nitrosopumilus cobalaminigenes]